MVGAKNSSSYKSFLTRTPDQIELEKSYHITLTGLVQGVGFRPHVHQLATKLDLSGWVSNNVDGVHIEINADEQKKEDFLHSILNSPPEHSTISSYVVEEVPPKISPAFTINESSGSGKPSLLISPDIAICSNCKADLSDPENNRFKYPFTTCLHCGPRYSIINKLPYDRPNTSMHYLHPCAHCEKEYGSLSDRRYFSQTNSCPSCAVQMHLFDGEGKELNFHQPEIITFITRILKDGKIAAVKGIGGYLLLCDAANSQSIQNLRQRKHRPAKPFALLYPSLEMLNKDVMLTAAESAALQSPAAPIVLLPIKEQPQTGACFSLVAPGLNKIGVMLSYSPLLVLIQEEFNAPLVATSGNLSGSPIIFNDQEAVEELTAFADYVLTFDREIVTPQDDSVIQFTRAAAKRIITRRSRGLAPNYMCNPLDIDEVVLAMGSELKSSFAVHNDGNLFISQYLGIMESFDSQKAFHKTLDHYLSLYKVLPEKILIDSHPGYFISGIGKVLAKKWNIPVIAIQHHKAHFAAVLAENDLLDSPGKTLGVIWDGTGYGDDGQIWGGEFFTFSENNMRRTAQLQYFPHLLGDKMSKEPRLSALAIFGENEFTANKFNSIEYKVFKRSLYEDQKIFTSSLGRILDAVASILNICDFNSYEGEAAMKLEAIAAGDEAFTDEWYPMPLNKDVVSLNDLSVELVNDIRSGKGPGFIARKVLLSLVKVISSMAKIEGVKRIAFSGGVFQNALLIEMINTMLGGDYQLYFHKELSPNDECIGFGQLAYYANDLKKIKLN